jgi:hypothetical protein
MNNKSKTESGGKINERHEVHFMLRRADSGEPGNCDAVSHVKEKREKFAEKSERERFI